MKYLSVTEFCKLYGKDRSNCIKLIKAGRIPAIKVGNVYGIPEGTEWPEDERVRNGNYRNWRKKDRE